MSIVKATNLEQIFQSFAKGPLKIEDLGEFYVSTFEGRGGAPVSNRLARKVRNQIAEGNRFHMLFAGYRGCGKSTELNQLQLMLQDDYLLVKFSVMEKLDPLSLHYIELFIVMMEELFGLGRTHNELLQQISPQFLERIQNWADTREIQEIRDKHLSLEATVEAKAGTAIPWFASFFAKFSAAAKSSRSVKETIKRNVEPKLSQLLDLCNDLIGEIEVNLPRIGKKGMVILVEDLDKIPLNRAKELFFNYANQITALRANIIYTFPIPLYYNTDSKSIAQFYTDTLELPMVKVNNRDGSPNSAGRDSLRDIVSLRMDTNLFESPEILEEMIQYSGGCMRDLFSMIVEGSDSALDFGREKITEADFRRAYHKLKQDYDRTIAEKVDPETGTVTPVEEYFKTLQDLAKSETKKLDNTQAVLDLRQNLAILGYNDTNWYDVHPIVKDILKEKGLL